MTELIRNQTIRIYPKEEGRFEVRDRRGNVKLTADEEFHIYFKRVEFHEEGFVRGTYLGNTEGVLLDNRNQRVSFDPNTGWVASTGRKFELARMASVENARGLAVLIEEE